MYIKCPKCSSDEVSTNTLVHGFANIDMKTGEVIESPEECDYEVTDIDELFCDDCGHKWEGTVSDELCNLWAKNQSEQYEKRMAMLEEFLKQSEIGPSYELMNKKEVVIPWKNKGGIIVRLN